MLISFSLPESQFIAESPEIGDAKNPHVCGAGTVSIWGIVHRRGK